MSTNWTLSRDRVHDHRDGDSWVVTVWENDAPSGDKIVAEVRARDRQHALKRAAMAAASPDLLSACKMFMEAHEAWISDETDTATLGEWIDQGRVIEAMELAIAKATNPPTTTQ